ncbi:hypothetical protein [Halobacillus salinus]|uniref:hypothetical protein n=1 Tax=Halobacillus salinus TaxID=192814 RepID=UPI0011162A1D|nr:hypothetical protein [Halobacillus salinus]
MSSAIRWVVVCVTAVISLYQFRYRIINFASSYPLIRKLMVRLTMNVPYVRKKLLGHMFQR